MWLYCMYSLLYSQEKCFLFNNKYRGTFFLCYFPGEGGGNNWNIARNLLSLLAKNPSLGIFTVNFAIFMSKPIAAWGWNVLNVLARHRFFYLNFSNQMKKWRRMKKKMLNLFLKIKIKGLELACHFSCAPNLGQWHPPSFPGRGTYP